MKNRKIARFAILIMCMFALCISFSAGRGAVFADSTGAQVTDSKVGDSALYSKLKSLALRTEGVQTIRDNTFNKNLTAYVNLDLSGTSSQQISDISGLKLFTLNFTKTLNISNNALTEVAADVLASMPNLETIIVSGNQLTSLDLTGCYKIKVVDASDNSLASFNGADINPADCSIDLSKNKFSSIKYITLPQQPVGSTGTVRLYNNNIRDLETVSGYNIYLGLQGLTFNDTTVLQKADTIRYYKSDEVHRIKTVIAKAGTPVATICDWKVTKNYEEYALEVGEYTVSYYYVDASDENTNLDISTKMHRVTTTADSYYSKVSGILKYYNNQYNEFTVIPTVPTYQYMINDTLYDESEVTRLKSKATIMLSADSNADIYYKFGENGEWKKGKEIKLTKGGSYFIDVKAVVDGYESRTTTIFINANANLNIPTILLLLAIVLGAGILFGVGYPLIRKYVL